MKRHALFDLKACFVANDAYPLSLWDRKSDDWCEWEGVVCNNQIGHFAMLDLSGAQFGPFHGEISASLIELQ